MGKRVFQQECSVLITTARILDEDGECGVVDLTVSLNNSDAFAHLAEVVVANVGVACVIVSMYRRIDLLSIFVAV